MSNNFVKVLISFKFIYHKQINTNKNMTIIHLKVECKLIILNFDPKWLAFGQFEHNSNFMNCI